MKEVEHKVDDATFQEKKKRKKRKICKFLKARKLKTSIKKG